MTKAYRDAYTVAVKNEKSNAWYPLSNAIAGAVALSWQPRARKDAAAGVDADMSKLRDYCKEDGRKLGFCGLTKNQAPLPRVRP